MHNINLADGNSHLHLTSLGAWTTIKPAQQRSNFYKKEQLLTKKILRLGFNFLEKEFQQISRFGCEKTLKFVVALSAYIRSRCNETLILISQEFGSSHSKLMDGIQEEQIALIKCCKKRVGLVHFAMLEHLTKERFF